MSSPRMSVTNTRAAKVVRVRRGANSPLDFHQDRPDLRSVRQSLRIISGESLVEPGRAERAAILESWVVAQFEFHSSVRRHPEDPRFHQRAEGSGAHLRDLTREVPVPFGRSCGGKYNAWQLGHSSGTPLRSQQRNAWRGIAPRRGGLVLTPYSERQYRDDVATARSRLSASLEVWMQPEFRFFVGVDWGTANHVVCVWDQEGGKRSCIFVLTPGGEFLAPPENRLRSG